ncbi:MAG: large-conductance mechanosensitive channel protein MscL [Clostridiales bacterium]|jgi:large conductance mechanosensitive channel|nr:large-conductance mechanosensitive channel protein MscL [Clostridiales bacterium]
MPKKKRRKLIDEFKKFALRGNVIDLAVGVIIGGAFSKITSSLVSDILTPVIGMFLGGINFENITITLPAVFRGGTEAVINLGIFISTVIDFFILALIVFIFVKLTNNLKRKEKEPDKPPEPSKEVLLLTEIRDLMKEKV